MTEVNSQWSETVAFTVVGEDWPTVEYAKIFPNDLIGQERFGSGVALSGDGTLALVGAKYDDTNGTDTGCVHVYSRMADSWTRIAKFYSSDGAANDNFGISVALSSDGQHALVGAAGDDDAGSGSGSAYYFTQVGGVWTQRAKLVASDAAAGDWFGRSCALNLDGSVALIGATSDDVSASGSGSVYYFTRSGSVWTQQSKLHAGDPIAGGEFGTGVALNDAGTKAIITSVKSGSEAFYVFNRSGAVWSQETKINATGTKLGSLFGYDVALNGDGTIALLSAPNYDVTKGSSIYSNSGSVYVYRFIASVWTQETVLVASDPEKDQFFGTSVSLDATGAMALIGASGDDSRASDTGAVYFFN